MHKHIISLGSLVGACLIAMLPNTSFGDVPNNCSNASLNGSYAFSFQGTLHTPPNPAVVAQAAISGVINYDGNGKMTSTRTKSINGVIEVGKNEGTYSVNSDCSGSATFNDGLSLNAVAVQFEGNVIKEMYFMSTLPGTVAMGNAKRQ